MAFINIVRNISLGRRKGRMTRKGQKSWRKTVKGKVTNEKKSNWNNKCN